MRTLFWFVLLALFCYSCSQSTPEEDMPKPIAAADILGDPVYRAISFGGYRQPTREAVPTVEDLKEDLAILQAMGIKLLRTYNTQQFAHAANLLEAIKQMKAADSDFEMYVMLGAWIDCENAWTDSPNHEAESLENNTAEIDAAVRLTNQYPDIVKVIAVGNEAMVHWATSYFVYPDVILKWVNHLTDLRRMGTLPEGVWITSSDNFASWGGGDDSYHRDDLAELIEAVDYLSLHTYPFHDSHYTPDYWLITEEDMAGLTNIERIDAAMLRARDYAQSQYQSVVDYMSSLGIEKPVHIGETGWATKDSHLYGDDGSRAADEYKSKLYHDLTRNWTDNAGISCFYFEAFDEQWKDPTSDLGSENHFGLINLQGQAKYVLWEMVDAGVFNGLRRGGHPITKTFGGDTARLMETVMVPPLLEYNR
ncbi:MAG: glycosyl hydrolase family 17 protein [Bacteroidota bacterium]